MTDKCTAAHNKQETGRALTFQSQKLSGRWAQAADWWQKLLLGWTLPAWQLTGQVWQQVLLLQLELQWALH